MTLIFDASIPVVTGSPGISGTVQNGVVTVTNSSTSRVAGATVKLANVVAIPASLDISVLTGVYGGTRQPFASGLWTSDGGNCSICVWEAPDGSGGVAWR